MKAPLTFWVVTYDIPSDNRRRKVAKVLDGFGTRVNESVFECNLTASQYERLRARLDRRLKPEEDAVRFYPLPASYVEKIETVGGVEITALEDIVII